MSSPEFSMDLGDFGTPDRKYLTKIVQKREAYYAVKIVNGQILDAKKNVYMIGLQFSENVVYLGLFQFIFHSHRVPGTSERNAFSAKNLSVNHATFL